MCVWGVGWEWALGEGISFDVLITWALLLLVLFLKLCVKSGLISYDKHPCRNILYGREGGSFQLFSLIRTPPAPFSWCAEPQANIYFLQGLSLCKNYFLEKLLQLSWLMYSTLLMMFWSKKYKRGT